MRLEHSGALGGQSDHLGVSLRDDPNAPQPFSSLNARGSSVN